LVTGVKVLTDQITASCAQRTFKCLTWLWNKKLSRSFLTASFTTI
jgi:hypothetical protein